MPWELLGLDQETASEKDVKRAYAQRLKITRPDRDPEGFKKLNDAYQLALHLLQHSGAVLPVATHTHSVEAEPENEENVVSIHSSRAAELSIKKACDALEDAIVTDNTTIAEQVREVEEALYQHPECAEYWGKCVVPLIEKYPCHPELLFKPAALLFEIQHQSGELTFAIINRLDKMGRKAGIEGLSQHFLKSSEHMNTPLGTMIYVRLATSAGMWELSVADRLANTAYLQLAPGERDYYMDLIDQYKHIGNYLQGIPDVWRRFWTVLLIGNASRHDWSDEESEAALSELSRSRSRLIRCYSDLINLLPPEIAASLPARAEMRKHKLRNQQPIVSPQFLKTWQYVAPKPTTDNTRKSQYGRRGNDDALFEDLSADESRSYSLSWEEEKPQPKSTPPTSRPPARPKPTPQPSRTYRVEKKSNFPIFWLCVIGFKIILLMVKCAAE